MNKEEVLKMAAGERLDAFVAEMVMGIQGWFKYSDGFYPKASPYSTDPSAAWQVVGKMFEFGYGMSLLHLSSELYPEYWYCDFRLKGKATPPEYEWVDHQKTGPEAICKAALLARLEGAR